MEKGELYKKMLDCPEEIYRLRSSAQETIDLIEQVRQELKDAECHALLDDYGPIKGKNEQIRGAQLYEQTRPERIRLNELERVLARRELLVELAENQFQAYLAASRMLAPDH